MKNSKLFTAGILALMLAFGLILAGCSTDAASGGGGNSGGNTAVTFTSVLADGSSSQATTQLTLIFSQAITGLSANDVILSGVSGVNKGALNGSGPVYTLDISGFSAGGTLSVIVAKSGYNISGSPQTVAIYSTGDGGGGGGTAVTFNSASANGSSSQPTTELTLSFSQAITGLSASDITLSGVSGVSKGTLSGSNPYTLPISGFGNGGSLNVQVSKSGYNISGSPKTVAISYKALSAPTNVVADDGQYGNRPATSRTSIKITWTGVSGAVKYNIYEYLTTLGGQWDWIGTTRGTETEWTHTGLQPGKSHRYVVRAVDSGGNEGASSSDYGTLGSTLP